MRELTYDKQRIINFTDAVFSIAITLLVLEITVPSYNEFSRGGTSTALANLVPNFIGFVVSFFVIALYWIAHMRLMKFAKSVDIGILRINLMLLFFIILLPFSTAFYVKGISYNGTFIFYCLNIVCLGLMVYFLGSRIFSKSKSSLDSSEIYARWERARALLPVIIWLSAALLSLVSPLLSKLIFILIFVFQYFVNRHFTKLIKAD